jgi:hypothetical protein
MTDVSLIVDASLSEPSVEKNEITEEIKLLEVKLLSEILLDIFKKDKNKDLSILLNKESVSILIKILDSNPELFNDIEKTLVEIVKDNKIDSSDLPNLIILIQKLYEFVHKVKDMKLDNKKRAEICSELLKYIVHILVVERKIKIDEDKQAVFIELTNKVIDSCVGLLFLNKSLRGKGCFKTIFNKK